MQPANLYILDISVLYIQPVYSSNPDHGRINMLIDVRRNSLGIAQERNYIYIYIYKYIYMCMLLF